ncbi:MAG: hypothetical protein SF029_19695 [bacterium]|nr:hypothetical protein [bacterium]
MSLLKPFVLIFSAGLLLMGVFTLNRVLQAVPVQAAETLASDVEAAPDVLTRLVFTGGNERPYLLSADGQLFQPQSDAIWTRVDFPFAVRDLHSDAQDCTVAADDGLYTITANGWQREGVLSSTNELIAMHGFTFALSESGAARAGHDGWAVLDIPQPNTIARDLAMLGDHSHILLNGNLYSTPDMGLSWEPLDAPENALRIAADSNGDLLAVTANALLKWTRGSRQWSTLAPLPEGHAIDMLRAFDGRTYALADDRLYRLSQGEWERVEIAGRFTALEARSDRLWLLDGAARVLWHSRDGVAWEAVSIIVNNVFSERFNCQSASQ